MCLFPGLGTTLVGAQGLPQLCVQDHFQWYQELPCNAEDRTRVGHVQGKGLNPCTISLFLHWELGLDVKDGGHLVIQNRREDTVGTKEKK